MKRALWVGLAGAALFVAAHPPMLGLGGQARFPGWDLTRVFWADLAFMRRVLAGGELPLWNPYDRAGYSFVAEPQSAVYDPLTWLLVAVALVVGSAPAWLAIAKPILLYGISAAGMDAYLRERRLPPWAAALGTVAFILCPRMDKLKDQSALWPVAWMGWLLLAVERCVARPGPRSGAWLGAALGMSFVAGYPPSTFRMFLIAAPLGVVALVEAWLTAADRRAWALGLARAAGAAATVAFALSAAQVAATVSILGGTLRAALGEGEVLRSTIVPSSAVGLLVPQPATGPLLLYAGFAPLAGALAGLALARPARAVALAAVAALGFLLACGGNAPLLPAALRLPGFSAFRIAEHYALVPAVALAIAGATGASALASAPPRAARALAGGVAALLGARLAFGGRADAGAAIAFVVAAPVAALALAGEHRRAWIGWALVVATATDLLFASRPVARILQPMPDLARAEKLARAAAPLVATRVADFEWAGRRPGPHAGVRDFAGARPALADRSYMLLYRAARADPTLLAAMNVGIVATRDRKARARLDASPGAEALAGPPGLYRVRDPWPLAAWVGSAELVRNPSEVLERLRKTRGPTAVLDEADAPEDARRRLRGLAGARASVPARVVTWRANRVVLDVDAPADGLVVVAESYDPDWHATVDGTARPLLRANLIHRAVELAAGRHRVEFRYLPRGVLALSGLWLAALAGLGVLMLRRAAT